VKQRVSRQISPFEKIYLQEESSGTTSLLETYPVGTDLFGEEEM
jgi:hypothetical protein